MQAGLEFIGSCRFVPRGYAWLTGIHSAPGPSKDHVSSSGIGRNYASGASPSHRRSLPFLTQSNRACRKIQAVPTPPPERSRVLKMRSKRTRLSKGWSWKRSNRWYGWKYTVRNRIQNGRSRLSPQQMCFRSHSLRYEARSYIHVQMVQHWNLMQRLAVQIDMAKF